MDARSPIATHKIRVSDSKTEVLCNGDEAVLHALERSGQREIRVGCRQGGCGACRVQVTSGEYDTLKMSRAHVSEEEEEQGYVLSCKLFAKSDLTIVPARKPIKRAK